MNPDRTDRRTPRWLFDRLNAEFKFVLDAAASHENHLCPIYFTIEDNALEQDWWPHRRIWLNPPYDDKGTRNMIHWMGKAYREAQKCCIVVCLVPASVDARWWHEYCVKGNLRWIKGRLRFSEVKTDAKFPSVIVIFSTWRLWVRHLLEILGGQARLRDLYDASAKAMKYSSNNHVPAKIRQVLQMHGDFSRLAPGLWSLNV